MPIFSQNISTLEGGFAKLYFCGKEAKKCREKKILFKIISISMNVAQDLSETQGYEVVQVFQGLKIRAGLFISQPNKMICFHSSKH